MATSHWRLRSDRGLQMFNYNVKLSLKSMRRNPIMTAMLPRSAVRRNPFALIPRVHVDVGPSGGDTRVYPLVEMKSNYLSHAGTHTSACGVTAYRGDLLADTFQHSLFVYTSVMSTPAPGRAVVDAGLKASSVDSGLPTVHGRPGITFTGASDEHGKLEFDPHEIAVSLGDKLKLVPGHCDPTVNLYDWYVCVRDGRVQALWPIAARGALL